jgi:hypothetical protein
MMRVRDMMDIIRQYNDTTTTAPVVNRIKEEISFEEDTILYVSHITYLLYAYVLVSIHRPGPWRIVRYGGDLVVTDGVIVIASSNDLPYAIDIVDMGDNVCDDRDIIPLLYKSLIDIAIGGDITPDHRLLHDRATSFTRMIINAYPPPYGCSAPSSTLPPHTSRSTSRNSYRSDVYISSHSHSL